MRCSIVTYTKLSDGLLFFSYGQKSRAIYFNTFMPKRCVKSISIHSIFGNFQVYCGNDDFRIFRNFCFDLKKKTTTSTALNSMSIF